jgi:hypothetical protein
MKRILFSVVLCLVAFSVVGSATCTDDSCSINTDPELNEGSNTYSDLVDFLIEDDTNEHVFKSSKKCSKALLYNLDEANWEVSLVKVTLEDEKRYCVAVDTSDEGLVYIDCFTVGGGAIDKRVTQLEKGEQWLAESVDGTCPLDDDGFYNRGIVEKIRFL